MELSNLPKSKFVIGLMTGIIALVVLLGVFQLGVMVGSHKERFNCQWGERYGKMLGMPFEGNDHFGMAPPPGMLDPNGAVGDVVSSNGQQMVLKSKDGAEKTVMLTPQTEIRIGRDIAKPSDITDKDSAVVFGSPTGTGQIEAKLIRIFDHKANQ